MSDENSLNTPENLEDFKGKFIVFFSEEDKPTVLFSSLLAQDAFTKAKEIEDEQGRKPVVIRVSENTSNIAQMLTARV